MLREGLKSFTMQDPASTLLACFWGWGLEGGLVEIGGFGRLSQGCDVSLHTQGHTHQDLCS